MSDNEEVYVTEANKKLMNEVNRHKLIDKKGKKFFKKSKQSTEEDSDSLASNSDSVEDQEIQDVNEVEDQLKINIPVLHEKLCEIKLDLSFDETLAFVSQTSCKDVVPDVEDDFVRETAFYNQALSSVREARKEISKDLKKFNLPKLNARPDDFYAEMLKTDKHMGRIKQNLLFEQQKMEVFEKRKKNKEYRKVAKKVQAEKIVQRKQQVKENVDEARKGGKRKMRDEKFGYGGRKKGNKKNTQDSINDFRDFNKSSKDRKSFGAKDGNGNNGKKSFGNAKGNKVPAKRLGKSRRDQNKTQKRR